MTNEEAKIVEDVRATVYDEDVERVHHSMIAARRRVMGLHEKLEVAEADLAYRETELVRLALEVKAALIEEEHHAR